MASTRYVLGFGSTNAGGAPTFLQFIRLDTLAALSQPTIHEIASGDYYFDWDWATSPAQSVAFVATLGGVELADVISGLPPPGTTTATAASNSLTGYQTVGTLVARAGTQAGFLNLNPASQATYDPFASADPNVVQMLELLNALGTDLVAKTNFHLRREMTFTTAGAALSYALPTDYVGIVDDTGWDRTNQQSMLGPVSSQYAAELKAWIGTTVTHIPFRVQGNLLTFPVDPGNGLTCAFEYVSNYWAQTAASATGPDLDHVTASSDYVLFDPLLVVRGLKLYFLQAKGRDTGVAYTEFMDRLDTVKGRTAGGPTLSLCGGRKRGIHFLNGSNIPDGNWRI